MSKEIFILYIQKPAIVLTLTLQLFSRFINTQLSSFDFNKLDNVVKNGW